uniref:Uncharacterized protein n=1 Tax=viral metagenome TaxID=1070528 RepID=A0A6C0BDP2_9ZZZZ
MGILDDIPKKTQYVVLVAVVIVLLIISIMTYYKQKRISRNTKHIDDIINKILDTQEKILE